MAWDNERREKSLRTKQRKAVLRNGKIRKAKAKKPDLTLYELAGKFDCSHMTIKRALAQQTTMDF